MPEETKPKLSPCPFCGTAPEQYKIAKEGIYVGWILVCHKCEYDFKSVKSEADVLERWNNRWDNLTEKSCDVVLSEHDNDKQVLLNVL